MVKENLLLTVSEYETELQELNRINMGQILHSANTCVNHVTDEMIKYLKMMAFWDIVPCSLTEVD
jgi:hypothetical protein